MKTIEALNAIDECWKSNAKFADKISTISEIYYGNGLKLDAVASYINATPAELDALLKLSALDDELIEKLSKIDPPKTTWAIFAEASEEEIVKYLNATENQQIGEDDQSHIIKKLFEIAEPDAYDKVAALPYTTLEAISKRADAYGALEEWPSNFLKSIVRSRKSEKQLSEKQLNKLIEVLTDLANKDILDRNSIDGDAKYCSEVLDALGR